MKRKFESELDPRTSRYTTLYIDSSDAVNGIQRSDGSFEVKLNRPIDNVRKVKVHSFKYVNNFVALASPASTSLTLACLLDGAAYNTAADDPETAVVPYTLDGGDWAVVNLDIGDVVNAGTVQDGFQAFRTFLAEKIKTAMNAQAGVTGFRCEIQYVDISKSFIIHTSRLLYILAGDWNALGDVGSDKVNGLASVMGLTVQMPPLAPTPGMGVTSNDINDGNPYYDAGFLTYTSPIDAFVYNAQIRAQLPAHIDANTDHFLMTTNIPVTSGTSAKENPNMITSGYNPQHILASIPVMGSYNSRILLTKELFIECFTSLPLLDTLSVKFWRSDGSASYTFGEGGNISFVLRVWHN